MPKLKEDIFAVPDGAIYPQWFRAGEEVIGCVAVAAKELGKLQDEPKKLDTKPMKVSRKAMKSPENK